MFWRRKGGRAAAGFVLSLVGVLLLGAGPAGAQGEQAKYAKLALPEDATKGLAALYNGNPEAGIAYFRRLESRDPENPLGYLLEADAMWWKIYCASCRIQWNMIDAWDREAKPGDKVYLSVVDQAIAKADARLAQRETAELHLYASLAWALRARLVGLRMEKMDTARAGVKSRKHALRALELDAGLADAYAPLGLYNYYVDTLSGFVKVIRFFMGIPGGNKEEGVRQIQKAIAHGQLTPPEARFYLAVVKRNHEQKYEESLALLGPLVEKYPGNPVFHLLLGDFYGKLGRNEQAAAQYREAQRLGGWDAACKERVAAVAQEAMERMGQAGTSK